MKLRMATEYDVDFMLYVQEKLNKKYVEKHLGIWNLESQKYFLGKSMDREKYNIIYDLDDQIGIFAWNEDEECIHLYELLILKKFQNNGIGTMLLNMLSKRGEYFGKKVEVHVFKSNKKALEFYERRGFEIDSENKSHYILLCKKGGSRS